MSAINVAAAMDIARSRAAEQGLPLRSLCGSSSIAGGSARNLAALILGSTSATRSGLTVLLHSAGHVLKLRELVREFALCSLISNHGVAAVTH